MSLPPPPKAEDAHDKLAAPAPATAAADPHHDVPIKPGEKPDDSLNVTFGGAIRAPSPVPSLLSVDDASHVRTGRAADRLAVPEARRHASRSPVPTPRTWGGSIRLFWTTNKGLALVLFSQLFGTLMNVTTRMLEIEGNNGMSQRPACGLSRVKSDPRPQGRATTRFRSCSPEWASLSFVQQSTCGAQRQNTFPSA